MNRNWQLLRLLDLYRTAGRMRRMAPWMAREIRRLERGLSSATATTAPTP
jgi:hypothetical protein